MMNNRSSIFAGLGLLLALFATILTFAGQSDQGRKAFDGAKQQLKHQHGEQKGQSEFKYDEFQYAQLKHDIQYQHGTQY